MLTVNANRIAGTRATEWLDGLQGADRAGAFLASVNMYIAAGRNPTSRTLPERDRLPLDLEIKSLAWADTGVRLNSRTCDECPGASCVVAVKICYQAARLSSGNGVAGTVPRPSS